MFPYLSSSDKNEYVRKDTLPGLKCLISQSVLNHLPNKGASPKLSASATVEAVCVMPVILFFFITVMWFMDLFYIHSEIAGIVNSVGNEMVAYSYPYNSFLSGDNQADVLKLALQAGWKEGYLRNEIKKTSISDRISFLSTILSNVTEGEIDIVATYFVEPYITIPGLKGVFLTNHFYSKSFTGYDRKDAVSEEMVYITRTGDVYHTYLNCTALNIKPSEVFYDNVDDLRNESGSKYYPCSFCKADTNSGSVYITPFGNRYHSSPNCSQLDIDIFEVPISSAGERRICKYCNRGEK